MTLTAPAPAPRSTAGRTELPPRPAPNPHTIVVWVIMLGLLAGGVWSMIDLGVTPEKVFGQFANAGDFLSRTLPLDFPEFGELMSMTVETLAIVLLATAFSVFVSLPLAVLAAANTTTGPFARFSSRVIIMFCRAVPDIVFAVILFRLFGLGALVGILAMGLSSIGMVGKLYADAIEEIDKGPSEAIQAAGGGRWQWILSTVIPQIMPQIIATGLHRFDINLRASVILGYVGVGGIGYYLAGALNTMQWQRGMALALVVLVLCIVVELIAGVIRMAIMGRGKGGFIGLLNSISDGWVTRPVDTHSPQRLGSGRVRVSPPWDGARIARTLSIGTLLVLIALAVLVTDLTQANFGRAVENFFPTMGQFFPPSGGGNYWDFFWPSVVETVQMGLAATLLGVVLAIPVGSLAARNVAPSAAVATGFRVFIVVVRGIPELILAIILLVIVGFGPVPGVLALGFGAIGLLSKLVADSIEETDVRVQDAVRAGGANRAQVYFAATLRQTAPAMIAHVMYQLDVNIRASTLLGIVGAGGVGYWLLQAHRLQQFDVLALLIINILVVVLIVEGLALYMRKVIR
ncbi:phosphonate ABC transporter, permease protein PhnE [Nesterenkonia massiliensis]|uniref:phosphonate ABC transporter, permease protein PhnE n=1 Tax=Nesterenkonia massiliensis TaxID=1232429 RepID=UPI000400CF81|nr:phosphonate ABC transporter, permease protein PhnE [Nesterenkonia massiliensis]